MAFKLKTTLLWYLFIIFGVLIGVMFLGNNLNPLTYRTNNSSILKQINQVPKLLPSSASSPSSNISSQWLIEAGGVSSSESSKIKVDNANNVYVAWIASDAFPSDCVFFRIFYYANQSWSPILNVSSTKNLGDSDDQVDFIVQNNGIVYMTWTRFEIGTPNIWFAQLKYDLFVTAPQQLSSPALQESRPIIQMDASGNTMIAYVLNNGGLTFEIRGYYHNGSDPIYNAGDWLNKWLVNNVTGINFNNLQNFAAYWDNSGNQSLYLLWQCELSTTNAYNVYFGRMTAPFGQNYQYLMPQSNYVNVTNLITTTAISANYLTLAINDITGYIYIGWNEGNSPNRLVNVYNKTIMASNFNSNPCFTTQTFGGDCIKPGIGFDANNQTAICFANANTPYRMYCQYNLTTSPIEIHDPASLPSMAISPLNNIFITYQYNPSSVGTQYLQEVDRNIPQVQINYPLNNTFTTGSVLHFNIIVSPDVIAINYSYFNGTQWFPIALNTTTCNFATGEVIVQSLATYWNVGTLDYPNITIGINATNKDLLYNYQTISNLTIDNNKPQTINWVSLIDQYNNNGSSAHFGRGNININFSTYDNCSGVGLVQLWNGSQELADNSTGIHASNQLIWQTNSSTDGNYTDLFLQAVDRAGNTNQSQTFNSLWGSFVIKNTPPALNWTSFIVTNAVLNTTYLPAQNKIRLSHQIDINMTTSSDAIHVNVSYYNAATNLTQIGGATYLSNNIWTIHWSTDGYPAFLNGSYTLNATAWDIYGNAMSFYLNVSVINIGPSPAIITPIDAAKVGYLIDFVVSTDLDTQYIQLGYTFGASGTPFNQYLLSQIMPTSNNVNVTPSPDGSQLILNYWLSVPVQDTTLISITMEIGIMAWDDQQNNGSCFESVSIQNEIPPTVLVNFGKSHYQFNTSEVAYDNVISFAANGNDPQGTLNYYLIYRSLEQFNVLYLNSLNYAQRMAYLGNQPGDQYCIGEISYLELNLDNENNPTYYDYNITVTTFYYVIIAVNIYGTPSNCSGNIVLTAPLIDQIQHNINYQEINSMPYIAIGVVVLMAIISAIAVKRTHTVRKTREVRKKLVQIQQDETTLEKGGEGKSLEQRLDEIETQIEGKQPAGKTTAKKQMIDADDFLNMRVEVKKSESIIGSAGLRKCPNCGWTLSSTAIKCPKCGRLLD